MELRQFELLPPWEWPKDRSEILHGIVTDRSRSAADREAAAGYAGETVAINDQLVDDLLAIVGDTSESERLRALSAISLGPVLEELDTADFDDPDDPPPASEATYGKIKDSLHRFFNDGTLPKEVRRRVLEAAVRSPQDWHTEAIKAAYASDDREWKLTAVFGMRFISGFESQILETLKSSDPEIQREAVAAAGAWEIDKAWPEIRTLLENRNTPKPLLLYVIEAAGQIGGEGSLDLLERLGNSKDEDIKAAAEDAMGFAGMEDFDFEDDDDEEDEEETD